MSASTGTFVAAGLEAAGYHAQAMVLQDLMPFFMVLATFLFTAACAHAIFSYVYYGSYMTFLRLLIGPVFFFYVIRSSAMTSGPGYQFGLYSQPVNYSEILCSTDMRGEQICSGNSQAKVNGIFLTANDIISSIVRMIVVTLTEGGVNPDSPNYHSSLKYLAKNGVRQQALEKLYDVEIDDPGLLEVIHTGLRYGKCPLLMDSYRRVAESKRDSVRRGSIDLALSQRKGPIELLAALKVIADHQNVPDIQFQDGSSGQKYISDLIFAINSKRGDPQFRKFYDPFCKDAGMDNYLNLYPNAESPMTCEQIWCLSGVGSVLKARELTKQSIQSSINPEFYTNDLYAEIERDLTIKMTPPCTATVNDQGVITNNCPNLSNNNLTVLPDPSIIPTIIGGLLLKKAMEKDPASQMMSEVADKAGYEFNSYNLDVEKMKKEDIFDYGQRNHKNIVSITSRYELYGYAMSVPYFQGFLLYTFALLFPFFTVFLVIPGKSSAFVSWFKFWGWIKSWDIGFAIVMIADNVFWEMMPHSSSIDILKDPNNGPLSIMEAAFAADQSYSMGMYYYVMSILYLGVPAITGQVILGPLSSFAGTMTGGISTFGKKAANFAADANSQLNQIRISELSNKVRAGVALNGVSQLIQSGTSSHKGIENAWRQAGELASSGQFDKQRLANTLSYGGALLGPVGTKAVSFGIKTFLGGKALDKSANMRIKAGIGMKSKLIDAQSKYSLFESNESKAIANLNMIRQGASNRGEFWWMSEYPASLEGDLMLMQNQVRTINNQANTFDAISALSTLVPLGKK